MEIFFNLHAWVDLLVLTLLELTLSGDNIVFLITCTSKLPTEQQAKARWIGIVAAMVSRLLFLGLIFSATVLAKPLLLQFSIRDLIFIFGGGFLVINSFMEFKNMRDHSLQKAQSKHAKFWPVIIQILIIDIVFSIDSVLTAIGVSDHYWVMATAILIATVFMLIASGTLSGWLQKNPTLKVLALCFLVLIGSILVLGGFGYDVPSTYIYIPFAFALFTHYVIHYTQKDNDD